VTALAVCVNAGTLGSEALMTLSPQIAATHNMTMTSRKRKLYDRSEGVLKDNMRDLARRVTFPG